MRATRPAAILLLLMLSPAAMLAPALAPDAPLGGACAEALAPAFSCRAWSTSTGFQPFEVATVTAKMLPSPSNGLVLVEEVSEDGTRWRALDARTGAEAWSSDEPAEPGTGLQMSSAALSRHGATLYTWSTKSVEEQGNRSFAYFTAREVATGAILWTRYMGDGYAALAVAHDGSRVFALSGYERLLRAYSDQGHLLAQVAVCNAYELAATSWGVVVPCHEPGGVRILTWTPGLLPRGNVTLPVPVGGGMEIRLAPDGGAAYIGITSYPWDSTAIVRVGPPTTTPVVLDAGLSRLGGFAPTGDGVVVAGYAGDARWQVSRLQDDGDVLWTHSIPWEGGIEKEIVDSVDVSRDVVVAYGDAYDARGSRFVVRAYHAATGVVLARDAHEMPSMTSWSPSTAFAPTGDGRGVFLAREANYGDSTSRERLVGYRFAP